MSTFSTAVMILAGVYVLIMTGIGLYYYFRGIETLDDYITAGRFKGRGFPMAIIAASLLATNNGNANVLGIPEFGFNAGIGNLLYTSTFTILVYLSMLWIGPWLYDTAASTLPDVAYGRYGTKRLRYLVTGWSVLRSLFFLAVELYGTSLVIQFVFGIPWQQVLIPVTVVITLYTILGGIPAVGLTDILQWTVIVIGTSLVVPTLYLTTGSWSGYVVENTAAELTSIAPSIPIPELFALSLGASLWILADPSFTQRFLSASDRKSARRGVIAWIAIIYPWWLLLGVIGVYGTALVPGADPQTSLIAVTQQAFPPVVAAVVVTAIFAGTMSTADSQMNVISAMFVNDIYKDIKPDASEKHYLRAARIVTAIAGGAGFLLAPIFAESILVLSLHLQAIFIAAVVPLIVLGLRFSGLSERAAFYSSLLGGGIALVWIVLGGQSGLFGIQAVYPGLGISLLILIAVSWFDNRGTAEVSPT